MPAPQTSVPFGAQFPLFPALKFGRLQKPILRRRQRPFRAATSDGPYRLPKAISDRLETALGDFRNAEAAFSLALFLARFWSAPNRLEMHFPIDRRALAHHGSLDLTEGQIRGAIRTLERVGFLDRPISEKASRYRATAEGLHRKPILFAFATDYAAAFRAANQIAQRKSRPNLALSGQEHPRRKSTSPPNPQIAVSKSPKRSFSPKRSILMGQLPDQKGRHETALEESLANLGRALGISVLPLARKNGR